MARPLLLCSLWLAGSVVAQERFVDERFEHVPPDAQISPWMIPAAADLDRDGHDDLLVRLEDGHLVVWWNAGRADFTRSSTVLADPLTNVLAVAVDDFDGDGDWDIAASGQNGVTLYRQDAPRVFLPGPVQVGAAALGRFARSADLDGDGDADLVLVIPLQSVVCLNVGGGSFVRGPVDALPGGSFRRIDVGDLDGDGDVDLVVAKSAARPTLVLLNDGTGRFTDATEGRLSDTGPYSSSVALGDLDRDGDLDLVVGKLATVPDLLFLNDGSGRFVDASSRLLQVSEETREIVVADVDGDGALDVVSALATGSLLVQRNDGSATQFSAERFRTSSTPDGLAALDADGDGRADVLARSPERVTALMLGGAVGRLAEAAGSRIVSPSATTNVLRLADLDGDGHLDLAMGIGGNYGPDGLWLFLNDGSGTMRRMPTPGLTVPHQVWDVAALDADGDGYVDLLPSSPAQTYHLWMNNGVGGFSDEAPQRLRGVAGMNFGIAWPGDFDRDGDVDVLVSGDDSGILVNDGHGAFDLRTTDVPNTFVGLLGLEVGDLDGDGDLDALATQSITPWAAVWLNRGDGRFDLLAGAVQPVPSGASRFSAHLADFDGDGDPDLVWAVSRRTVIYSNDGTGRFGSPIEVPGAVSEVVHQAAGDLDADGDDDLLQVAPTGALSWLRNDGTGVLAPVTGDFLERGFATDRRRVTLGDVDGDGDVDVLLGLEGHDRILANRTVQASLRRLSWTGGTLELEATDRRGGGTLFSVAIPLISCATLRTPVDPLGVLWLAPACLMQADPVYLPAGGLTARIDVPVPADPGLRGADVFAQLVFVHPTEGMALSGLVVTRIR